jgi:AbrB family transcriptional regulator (stage V sporulation protein T)
MKATGIVRRIDELGRIVVPKEIRRTLRIREGDPLEVYTDREGEIILKKYSPVGELVNFASQYAKVLSETTGKLVCITDKDHVIAAFGPGKKELENQPISRALERAINDRQDMLRTGQMDILPITEHDRTTYEGQAISVVNVYGDALGAVILLGQDEMSSMEATLVKTTANFLGSIMED